MYYIHILARVCSKSFNLGCSRTQTENFQMYKLGFKEAKEPEIKFCLTLEKERGFQENIYVCFIDCAKDFDHVDHSKLLKILKERRVSNYLTCLLRKLYADQEATVKIGHGTMDGFKTGKRVHQCYILSPCLFSLYV